MTQGEAIEAKFHYSANPDAVEVSNPGDPRPSLVDLSLVVTNPASDSVACRGIQFTLRVGDGTDDLTPEDKLNGIGTPTSSDPTWSIRQHADAVFRAVPESPAIGFRARESVTFVIPSVAINATPGGTGIQVIENFEEGRSESAVTIVKNPATLELRDLISQPPSSSGPGEEIKLSWTAHGLSKSEEHPTGVTLAGAPLIATESGSHDHVVPPVSALSAVARAEDVVSPHTVRPEVTTIYTLTAYGKGVYKQAQSTIAVVPPAPKITMFVGDVVNEKGTRRLVLRWDTEGANRCSMTGDAGSLNPSSLDDSYSVSMEAVGRSLSVTLTAHGAEDRSDHATITVQWKVVDRVEIGHASADVVMSPDGARLYSVESSKTQIESTTVTVVQTDLMKVLGTIAVGADACGAVLTASRLYVANYGNFNKGRKNRSLSVVDVAAMRELQTIAVEMHPVGPAIAPDGKTVYLAHGLIDKLSAIDTGSNRVRKVVEAKRATCVFAHPDGSCIYVRQDQRGFLVFSPSLSLDPRRSYDGGFNVDVLSPDGRWLMGTDSMYPFCLAFVDTTTATPSPTFSKHSKTRAIGFIPDSNIAICRDVFCNKFFLIEIPSFEVLSTFELEEAQYVGTGVIGGPGGDRLYVFANDNEILAMEMLPEGGVSR